MSDQIEKPEEQAEEEKLVVQEQQDGSVTVEGIPVEASEGEEKPEQKAEEKAEGGEVPEDGGDDDPARILGQHPAKLVLGLGDLETGNTD